MGAVAALSRVVPPAPRRPGRSAARRALLLAALWLAACSSTPPAGPIEPERPPRPGRADVAELAMRDLLIPVEGIRPDQLRDSFRATRSRGAHEAIDIMAPRGTPVRAVEDGRILKMSSNRAGGITLYQSDPGERYVYYYAHLDRYAGGLAVGQMLRRGDLIGTVGSTGNAPAHAPHLHFAIYRPGAPGLRWPGGAINPYAVWRGSGGAAEPVDDEAR